MLEYAEVFIKFLEMPDTHINSVPIEKARVLDSFEVLHNRPHIKWNKMDRV